MKDWFCGVLFGFSVLFLGGCLDQPAPSNIDPVEWQQLQTETRVRMLRLGILAAEVEGKLDHEQAVLMMERVTMVMDCIQKKPECTVPDLPDINDPLARLKLINMLMEKLEEDLQRKMTDGERKVV